MSINDTALVTLSAAREYLQLTKTTYDSVLEVIINAVSDLFCKYVGRQLAMKTYTDILLDGNSREYLFLPGRPIVEITSIYEDTNLLVEGYDQDYVVYKAEGMVRRVGGAVWIDLPQSIEITYDAGYIVQDKAPAAGETALPADIKLACLMQVGREWKRHQQADWGEISRTMTDGSVSRSERDALLPQVKAVLDNYVTLKV
jgi:hypothetical protein